MTAQPISDQDWRRLESCLGPDQVFPAQRRARVAGLDQAVAVVRWAGETGTRLQPLSRPGEAAFLAADRSTTLALDCSGLASVRFYEPGDLTVGVEAGMTPQRLNQMLVGQGQFLPLDAARAATRTLGAVLAAHASGPLRQQFGTVRDFTLGIEFITAEGQLVKGGGQVVKNVAGYDLMKLQIGARGSLGLITAANFKVFPLPREPRTMQLALSGWAAADALRHELLHSALRPLAVELASQLPRGVQASADTRYWAAVRFSGPPSVLQRYQAGIESMARQVGAVIDPGAHPIQGTEIVPKELAADASVWRDWHHWLQADAPILMMSAPPGQALSVLAGLADAADASGYQLHFAGRLLQGVYELQSVPAPEAATLQAWRALAARISPQAWLTIAYRGRGAGWSAADRWGGLANDPDLMRQLKRTYDPMGIFPDPFGLLG